MGYVMEAQKKELLLSLNAFTDPAEVSGVYAWIKLILHLLFMRKGTYPSNPYIGVGIQDYEFSFIDTAKAQLQNMIEDQVHTFLPDIPLSSFEIDVSTHEGNPILLFIFTFNSEEIFESAVVAASKVNNMIDFAIAI